MENENLRNTEAEFLFSQIADMRTGFELMTEVLARCQDSRATACMAKLLEGFVVVAERLLQLHDMLSPREEGKGATIHEIH